MPQEQQSKTPDQATPQPCVEDEPVSEDDYAAATARLVAQGTAPAFLIRPLVLAEVQRARQEAAPRPAAAIQTTEVPAASETTPAPAEPLLAPAPCSPTPQTPQAPRAPVPACVRTPTRMPPPTLRDVTLADLSDVSRLLALHEQAITCGWLRGGEAAQLTIVAAAVHAKRVGQAPCRLFVALLRDQRWEVITQEDEDQAHTLLRAHRDGPLRRRAAEACAPVPVAALSDDARFALLAPQVLRQAGWRGEPFLGWPCLVVIALGVLHQRYGALPLVQQSLTGMSAVAAGLLLASVVQMATVLPRQWRPWLFAGLAFVGVGVVRWPLLGVMGALAPCAIAMAWKGKD